MKLKSARVRNYRSIRDSGEFRIESDKTILVGPNEAGKTVLLKALQQIRPPDGIEQFDPLRDYPRALYNDITSGKVNPSTSTVVEAHFVLDDDEKAALPDAFRECVYVCGRHLDNSFWDNLENAPDLPTYDVVKTDLSRIAEGIDRLADPTDGAEPTTWVGALNDIVEGWEDDKTLDQSEVMPLLAWLTTIEQRAPPVQKILHERIRKLVDTLSIVETRRGIAQRLKERIPVFVLFSNYFRVKPLIHLDHLASRIASGVIDDNQYDYGNNCLLKLLGFTAKELSDLGRPQDPTENQPATLKAYRDQLDRRTYQLNAASIKLTREITAVWESTQEAGEGTRLRVQADGQYLKVVVEDALGVEVELDQRSEGFQWLVSFFVVFFAEAMGKHENAILLLDEPGLSLHALKQREFRRTLLMLSVNNQTLYTTHSPFLVGPDELDLVRVVEMKDRETGTKVHTTVTATDPAALLPLQECLGYDLAQSLYVNERNLILEGLTDEWYLESVVALLRDADIAYLNPRIVLLTAGAASKIVYFATFLHANNLKVAAILDSDAAGDQAAQQEVLVHKLGNKHILRTKDYLEAEIAQPEIEDLLRGTLMTVARTDLGWDIRPTAAAQPLRPILDIFAAEMQGFSKYKLAKAFKRWTREHDASELSPVEQKQWSKLIAAVNAALE